jgi:hypothetical protein
MDLWQSARERYAQMTNMNFRFNNLLCVAFCIASISVGCKKKAPTTEAPQPQASASVPLTEKVCIVAVAKTPLLTKPKKSSKAMFFGYSGDILTPSKKWPLVDWQGEIDGKQVSHAEEMLQVSRLAQDTLLVAFPSELKQDVTVPSVHAVCSKLVPAPEAAECETGIRRILLPDASILAWQPCAKQTCMAAQLTANGVQKLPIDFLSELRLQQVLGSPMLVATSRWAASTTHTGTTNLYYSLSPIKEVLKITTEDLDSHEPKFVRSRMGEIQEKDNALIFSGSQKDTDKDTAKVLAEKALREVYRRDPAGNLRQEEPKQ